MNFSFEKTADFLMPIAAPAGLVPGAPVDLALHADWLVCSLEVCIPKSGDFTLHLTAAAQGASPAPDPKWGAALARAVERLPHPAPFAVSARTDKDQLEIVASDAALAGDLKSGKVAALEFYPYEDGIIVHAAPQTTLASASAAGVRVPAGYLITEGKAPTPLPGLLVAVGKDGSRAGYEISAPSGAAVAGLAPIGSQTGQTSVSLGVAAAFALLGGLILNLMPCVFPVLSMKILGVLRHGGTEAASTLRRHGWLYTAGVLASFLALGLGLYVLRAGGAAVGWGYQLQSPVLVLFLAYLMFALSLSLFGVLTIGGGIMGAGRSLAAKPGMFGDFMTGVLATLVATPCTAPFMGAALGYAFVASPVEGLVVFLCLGLGLALPYLALAHAPGLLRRLPKPGVWMERLKQVFALPMLASCVWLLWVLAKEVPQWALGAAIAGLVLITFAAWAVRAQAPLRLWAGRVAAALAIAVPIGLVWAPAPAQVPQKVADIGDWTPYTKERLEEAVAAGEPVFIDLTADWCLTCKVNEWSALSSARVRQKFTDAKVVRLRGDWTNRDPAITALLTEQGRIGVPLYLYYPAGGKPVKILPQILTEDEVLRTIGG